MSDDSNPTGWINLSTTVNYGSWMSLSLTYTGSSIVCAVNGTTVSTDSSIDDNGRQPNGFSDILMQAYNFKDTSVPDAVGGNYTGALDQHRARARARTRNLRAHGNGIACGGSDCAPTQPHERVNA